MKKLIFYFIVLLAAVWLGILMHQNPGYVLISVAHTQIETTLWFAIIALIIVFVVLYALLRLLHGTYTLSDRYKTWAALQRERKSYYLSQQGMCELLEEQCKKAEATLGKAIKKHPQALVNYLGAAKAAHLQKAYARRDEYLKNARKIAKKSEIVPLGIIQATWELESNQLQEAATTFSQIKRLVPTHPIVLRGLQEVYSTLGNWEKVHKLLPSLRKTNALDQQQLPLVERKVFMALLLNVISSGEPEKITQLWKKIPQYLRHDPELLTCYIAFLLQTNRVMEAENLLKHQLRRALDKRLLDQYGFIHSKDPAKQLVRAEKWLSRYPNNADLLICLGQLCVRHRLWGKARHYLEKSLTLQPKAETYQLLGKVLENLGDHATALNYYRAALKIDQTPRD